MIRSEHADAHYTTPFIASLLEKEGGDLFDVRQAILGHVQQGGDPTPFDRIQATRLATAASSTSCEHASAGAPGSAMVGLKGGKVRFTELAYLPDLVEADAQRPREQAWLAIRPVADIMARPELHRAST
jgi:6-phosphofructokinase 1